MAKRAAIYTLGCRLNQSESALLSDRLEQAGYELVPFDGPADLGIINTCTVTGEADTKSRKMIRAFVRRNPHAFVAVLGCYSQVAAEAVAEIEGVDLVIGNGEKLRVLEYVSEVKRERTQIVSGRISRENFRIETDAPSSVVRRVNLKIQEGCNFMCSYCIVPYARGGPRSRELENVIDEARALVERGAKEIVLTGINVGAYRQNGHSILDVIDRLNDLRGLARIRLGSIELTTIPDGLLERMNDREHKLVPFLHIPLQSGSERILNLMRRTYTAGEAQAFLEKAHEQVSDLCLGTDLLLGFPGETETDFQETAQFFEDSPLVFAHVFKYSPRKGTPAADMDGRVEPTVLNERSAVLRRLVRRKRKRFHQRYVGRVAPVLFEQSDNETWTGYTPNYIRVAVTSHENLTNTIRGVVLLEPQGEHMRGSLNE